MRARRPACARRAAVIEQIQQFHDAHVGEIVDVEDQFSLERGDPAEVHQMAIATNLQMPAG